MKSQNKQYNKKNTTALSYEIPKLVMGKTRTYINVYYTDRNGYRQHKKPTFGLGRILHKKQRKERGLELVTKITWWLKHHYFFEDFNEWKCDQMILEKAAKVKAEKGKKGVIKKDILIVDAIEKAFELKMEKSKRNKVGDSSHTTYKSLTKNLKNYIITKQFDSFKAIDFNLSQAITFMLYSKKNRQWGNNTFNINKGLYQSLFSELKLLGYIEENPFSDIPKLEAEDVRRKAFTDEDAAVFLKYAYHHDRVLFYFILLDYICFARPIEIVKMRFSDIELEQERIVIRGQNAKKIKTRYAGIPTDFLHFFKEAYFLKHPPNFYIFGRCFKPNPNKNVSKSGINYRHNKIKNYLYENDKISTKKGYTVYSWKNIGVTHFIDALGVVAASEQAGHKDIKTTLKYKRKEEVNKKVKGFKNVLFQPHRIIDTSLPYQQ